MAALPRRSIRARILAWVLVMSALALGVMGGTLLAVQSRRIDAAADAALRREYQQFVRLAETGADPETGARFAEVERLLLVALQYRVAGPYQTFFTLLDGVPHAYSGGERPVALEDEPAALAAIASATDGVVVVRDVETSAGLVRLAVVPVTVVGDTTVGSFVIAHALGAERQELASLARLLLALGAVALLLIGVVGWLVTGELVRPLRRLQQATAHTTASDLGGPIPVTGEDEIAELTRNYNAMLERLRDAFEAQRALVDDVGHELRTPVTIARGHLELLDPGNPRAVAETRALLIDETDRMGRLVSDLILLAKTGRPDFIHPGPVDLSELTVDSFEKARALGDRRWALDHVADVEIVADGQRIAEAWLQLAENAVKYSSPASAIGMGSDADGTEARLWVRDEGVGIDDADLDRIFERFARSGSGRGTEGSGLGLTIARAIAEAHGGRIAVSSVAGTGSTFTLVVPIGAPSMPLPVPVPALSEEAP